MRILAVTNLYPRPGHETFAAFNRQQFAALFATEDRGIGMTSFVEHGPGKAAFEGR